MRSRTNFFKRAVILTALSISPLGVNAIVKKSAFNDAIEKVQSLLLNKKRVEAIKFLIEIKPTKAAEKKEWAEVSQDVATRFLTDKGQRSFELGQSQIPAQGANALKHLNEAKALEEGNYEVEVAIARVHLIQDDCKSAKTVLGALNPEMAMASEIQELLLQVVWCLDDQTEAEVIARKKGSDVKIPQVLMRTNQAWLKWKLKEPDRALSLLREAVTQDPQNPAILYWLWRVEKDQDLDAEPVAQVFVKRCRARDADIRRRTFSMVEFCLRLTEVEAYLKGKGADTQDGNS